MKKRYAALSGALVLVVMAVVGIVWAVVANTYSYDEHSVTIPVTDGIASGATAPDAHTGGRLNGLLTTPKRGAGPHGLIVMVHGDGPANATRDDAYKPIFEAFAKADYATLSWNKPGIGGAPGNWLDQALADRGAEVAAALDWAKQRADIDQARVGAWGVSQAGWVLPETAAHRPDIRFLILVGPAVNWLRQGEFNTRAELKADNASEDDRAAELMRRDKVQALLDRSANYQEYRASNIDDDPMSADRWGFVQRNYHADVTRVLPQIGVPTLLILGGADRNVDVAETARIYAAQMRPQLLTVRMFPNATHSITRDGIEYRPDDIGVAFRAIFAPRSIYAPGYLNVLTSFARDRTMR